MPDNPAPRRDDNPYRAEVGQAKPQTKRTGNRQLWLLLAGLAWFVIPMLIGLMMVALAAIRQAAD